MTSERTHVDSIGDVLREFEPLTKLIAAIPRRIPKGLSCHITPWTCIDVSDNWLVIGSTGIVYLYSRNTEKVEHRLTTLLHGDAVTRVKVRESVDTVVAVGNECGSLFVFQLSCEIRGIPSQKLKAYQVQGMHHSQITCLEWSANGMKLLSADDDGVVVCTDFDYTAEQCCSYLVCKEPHRAVQLCYSQRLLLLSTRSRTVVCNVDVPLRVTQVGQKNRKVLGLFGATFIQKKSSSAPMDMLVFAARPGLRLWKAEVDGTVLCTLTFSKPTSLAASLKQAETLHRTGLESDVQFGMLQPYGSDLLLSYTDSMLLLLDPSENGRVVFSRQESIADLSVNGDEIFILRNCSDDNAVPLVRLAQRSIYAQSAKRQLLSTTCPHQAHSEVPKDHSLSLSYSHTSLSGKLFGALKDYGSRLVSPQVVEGISDVHFVEPLTSYACTEADLALDASLFNSSDRFGDLITDRIPVVELEPGEIAKICISQDVSGRHPMANSVNHINPLHYRNENVSMSDCTSDDKYHSLISAPVNIVTTTSVDDVMQDDIVFSSAVKRRIKKSSKTTNVDKSILRGTSENVAVAETSNISSLSPADGTVTEKSMGTTAGITFEKILFESHSSTMKESPVRGGEYKDNDIYKQDIRNDPEPSYCSTSQVPCENEVHESHDSMLISIADNTRALDEPTSAHTRGVDNVSGVLDTSVVLSRLVDQSKPEPINSIVEGEKKTIVSSKLSERGILREICKPTGKDTAPGVVELSNLRDDDVEPIKLNRDGSVPCSELLNPDDSSSGNNGNLFGLKERYEVRVERRDGAKFYSEKSARQADDIEKYATSVSNRRLPLRVYTTHIDSKESADLSATLTSPSDDFHSIYASNNECPFAVAPASELHRPVPSAVPPVYLPNSDAWVDVAAPGNAAFPLRSLCVSRRTAWCIDRSDHLFSAVLDGPGVQWVGVDQPAQLFSCSPDGHIIWRLYCGSAYAAFRKPGAKSSASLEWREIARDVAHLSVDNHMAWYVKSNGDVMMQKELSQERTSYRSLKVPCDDRISMVICRHNTVWALNEQRHFLVRVGIQKDLGEGSDWCYLQGFDKTLSVSSFEIDTDRQVVWVVDSSGSVWFTSGVNSSQPQGSGQWFQVSTTGFEGLPSVTKTAFRALKELPNKLVSSSNLTSVNNSGLVSASANGVWVLLPSHTVFNVCHSSIIGHRWKLATPSGMLSSTRWRHLSATTVYDVSSQTNCCLLWLQQQNGSIFCSIPSVVTDDGLIEGRITEISPPSLLGESVLSLTPVFSALCATSDSLWGLMPNGRLFVRAGMTSHCLTGVEWVQIDVSQFGNKVKIVHIAAGLHNVWAVDNTGCVHLRIVTGPSSDRPVAWVKVPSCRDPAQSRDHNATQSQSQFGSGLQISKIFCGPCNWMVWAIDTKSNIYVREGIAVALPIGTSWTPVMGVKAETICISNQFIYAISPSRDCLVRHGITSSCPEGEYWKKIPGNFTTVSSAAGEVLWALDNCGQLHRRDTLCIEWSNVSAVPISDKSVNHDWEVV